MSKTETKARAGTDLSDGLSPAAEVKTAMAGFVSDLKDFQTDIKSQLQQQEERLTMLDRKSLNPAVRPALSAAPDIEAPHQKAFEAYLRSGDDDALRGLDLEGKAMSSAVAADGGYLVDPQTADTIKNVLEGTSSIRAIANVVNVALDRSDHHAANTRRAGFGKQWAQNGHSRLHCVGRHQHLWNKQDAIAEINAYNGHSLHQRLGQNFIRCPATAEQNIDALYNFFLQAIIKVIVHLLHKFVIVQIGEDNFIFISHLRILRISSGVRAGLRSLCRYEVLLHQQCGM